MPPFLRLRPTWPDRPEKDDWIIVDDQGECIGRTYWHQEAPPGTDAWTWSVGLYGRSHEYGRAASLVDAKAAIREAWAAMRSRITPAEYATAQEERRHRDEMVRLQCRPDKIVYVFSSEACARAEAQIEELMGCIEASAEAMELAGLVTLVEDWRARLEGKPPPSFRREEEP